MYPSIPSLSPNPSATELGAWLDTMVSHRMAAHIYIPDLVATGATALLPAMLDAFTRHQAAIERQEQHPLLPGWEVLLAMTAQAGRLDSVQWLLAHTPMKLDEKQSKHVNTALEKACQGRHAAIVQALCAHPISVPATTTVLISSLNFGDLACARMLLPYASTFALHHGFTCAADYGHLACLQLLMSHPMSEPWPIEKALFVAAHSRHVDCVEYLWPMANESLLVADMVKDASSTVSFAAPGIEFLAEKWSPESASQLVKAYGGSALPVLARRAFIQQEREALRASMEAQGQSSANQPRPRM